MMYSKTGIQGYTLFCLITAHEAVLNSSHNLCFEQKYENYQNFYLKIFISGGKLFSLIYKASFRYVLYLLISE